VSRPLQAPGYIQVAVAKTRAKPLRSNCLSALNLPLSGDQPYRLEKKDGSPPTQADADHDGCPIQDTVENAARRNDPIPIRLRRQVYGLQYP
jgi:hypothetical protein